LIRSKTDTGRIIICDERILTKTYGKMFMKGTVLTESFTDI